MTEQLMLARHGTQLHGLPPSAIVTAALFDLRHRERNKQLKRVLGHGPYETYAFLAKHVRRARSPAHLVLLALTQTMPREMRTTKPRTIDVYVDIGALFEALTIAEARHG